MKTKEQRLAEFKKVYKRMCDIVGEAELYSSTAEKELYLKTLKNYIDLMEFGE